MFLEKLLPSYIEPWFLFCALVFLTYSCEKRSDLQNNRISVNTSDVNNTEKLLAKSKVDHAYNAVMWLKFEKLINHRLLNKREEIGYSLAKPISNINNVLTSKGIQVSNLDSSILDQGIYEINETINMITIVNNDLSKTSQLLDIDWYDYYLGNQLFTDHPMAIPELKDIIFITHLLERVDEEKKLFSFLSNFFDTSRFLKVFFKEYAKVGDEKIPYLLDIQYEIYAKSKFFTALNIISSAELKEFEKTVWLNLISDVSINQDSFHQTSNSDSTIFTNLIFLDRNELNKKQLSQASEIERWYLTSLRTESIDICATVDRFKELNNADNDDVFDKCDCWYDYNRYLIVNSLNLIALQIISNDNNDYPIRDIASIDCLQSLTNYYFQMTGAPAYFTYGVVTPYFMVPYTLLASEHGSHQPFYLEYIASQSSLNPFMMELHKMYSEYSMYQMGNN